MAIMEGPLPRHALMMWTFIMLLAFVTVIVLLFYHDETLPPFHARFEGQLRLAIFGDTGRLSNSILPPCQLQPPGLVGTIKVNLTVGSFQYLENELGGRLSPGGMWKPRHCKARHQMAIVVPYRDRPLQLRVFLQHMHNLLQKQNIEYAIYVVELKQGVTFNRALLMNIGFVEANKMRTWQCFVFHDVDMYPIDDRNIYSCPESPRHLPINVRKHDYGFNYFGGAVSMKTEHFRKVNGMSNIYFGWGCEDDDLLIRVRQKGLKMIRYPASIARYIMFTHEHEKSNSANPKRFSLLRKATQRMATDGLNSLKYSLIKIEKRPLYTWIYVNVNQAEVMKGYG